MDTKTVIPTMIHPNHSNGAIELTDPPNTPINGASPRLRIQVSSPVVDRGDTGIAEVVPAAAAVVHVLRRHAPRVREAIETLVADADHVIGVEALDERGHLSNPRCQNGCGGTAGARFGHAFGGLGGSALGSDAARLIRELPRAATNQRVNAYRHHTNTYFSPV